MINDQDPIPLISLELNNVVGFDKLDFKKPLWQKKHQFGDRLLISVRLSFDTIFECPSNFFVLY